MNQSPSGSHNINIEMSLREHLLAAGAGQPQQAPQSITPGPPSHPQDPHAHGGLDPSIAPPGYPMTAADAGDGHLSESGRKGRRELSTSKRAAQNRAAQRAFRQRKEEYIKSLKDQVNQLQEMAEQYRTIQSENNTLRDYVINLQARLLESQGSYPDPPSSIDLSRPHTELPASVVQAAQNPPVDPRTKAAPVAPMSSMAQSDRQIAAGMTAAEREMTERLVQEAINTAAGAVSLNTHGRNVNGGGTKHSHEEAQYLPASNEYPHKRQKSEDTAGAPQEGNVGSSSSSAAS
ncbi:hypothetical protein BKA81DRAFT_410285 [Phyllosticta paracitricarpa]